MLLLWQEWPLARECRKKEADLQRQPRVNYMDSQDHEQPQIQQEPLEPSRYDQAVNLLRTFTAEEKATVGHMLKPDEEDFPFA
jgi:hypothetical protein